MKLTLAQLPQHLTKTLAPLYFIASDEILLVQEAIDMIRVAADKAGFDERVVLAVDVASDWEKQLHAAAHSHSLFSNKRVIELQLADKKPNAAATKILCELTTKNISDILFIITSHKLDAKAEQTKWFKAFNQTGVTLTIWPITADQLPHWIIERAKKLGLTITKDAATLLAAQVEGNLLAAAQEIEKLLLLNTQQTIDRELIETMVTDNARFDIFTLVECALKGDSQRCIRILHNLQAEGTEALLVLWALTRELRMLADIAYQQQSGVALNTLFAKHRIWEKRQPGFRHFLAKHSLGACWSLISSANHIDKMIKGARPGNVWQALQRLSLEITGNVILKDNAVSRI